MPRASHRRLALASLAVAAVIGGGACAAGDRSPASTDVDRQAEVAERGGDVMGFDLDATVHRFTPNDTGGIEAVTARDPGDEEEIADVRAHLEAEAERFSAGDFSAAAAIHGEDMPGLQELEAVGSLLTVEYTTLPDGARVTYSSADPDVVKALHDWFDAQLSDHGEHAEHG